MKDKLCAGLSRIFCLILCLSIFSAAAGSLYVFAASEGTGESSAETSAEKPTTDTKAVTAGTVNTVADTAVTSDSAVPVTSGGTGLPSTGDEPVTSGIETGTQTEPALTTALTTAITVVTTLAPSHDPVIATLSPTVDIPKKLSEEEAYTSSGESTASPDGTAADTASTAQTSKTPTSGSEKADGNGEKTESDTKATVLKICVFCAAAAVIASAGLIAVKFIHR